MYLCIVGGGKANFVTQCIETVYDNIESTPTSLISIITAEMNILMVLTVQY